MRICLATDSHAPSGMGVHMLALAEGLRDCEVTILARASTSLFERARRDYPVMALPEDDAALAARLRGGGFDLLHVHAGIGWEGHGLVEAAAVAGIPVIRTEHLPQMLTDENQQRRFAEAARHVAATIAVSDAVASSYARSGLLEAPPVVVRNGIAPPAAADATLARFERRPGRPLLLNVGRLAAQKNQALLIEAARLLADDGMPVDLMIVGDGPERAALAAHIAACGAEPYVRLMGQRDDVAALMRAADLYVHASAFEGLPLVILEAMAAGVPIVARAAPGVSEALPDDSAELVEGVDARALADGIARALADPHRTATRARSAQALQRDRFDAARMVRETRTLYRTHARKAAGLQQLRIGFIGAGGIACRHRDVLKGMEDVRIAAVADVARDSAEHFAEDVGARVHDDWQAMLAAGEIDAVFICVPPFAHGAIEEAVIAAGLPFFVEKPISLSLAQAERIATAAEARGLVTAVGYHWRWLDTLGAVDQALAGRRPRLLSGYWLDSTPPVEWWWRKDRSGGQMLEQATHIVDLARYLCGPVSTAYGLAEHSARASHPTLDVATASSAALSFESGAIGNFAATCLLGWNHRVGLHLFGDGFAVEITDHDVMIDVGAGRPVTPNQSDPVWHQDRAFVEAAMGGANRIRCTYRDALETLRVMDAIEQSATSGAAVRLAPAAAQLEAAA